MIEALGAIPTSASAVPSPRADRPAPSESFADALRRTAGAPVDPVASHAPSPRAAGAEAGESFFDAMRRTSGAPIDPARPERDIQPKRAGASPFGSGLRDRMDYTAHLPVEDEPDADPARAAAEELVAITMIQPILASLRESNMAADPFGPGDAERRFGPMWDAAIAHRIVKARGFGLVDEVARRVRQQGDGAERPAAPAEDPPDARINPAALEARLDAATLDLDA